jgi:histidinol dehydrogenase
MGDYCSGPNHTLPTYGYAKAYSGLGLEDFQKRITVQELSRGLKGLGPRRKFWQVSRDWMPTPRRSPFASTP